MCSRPLFFGVVIDPITSEMMKNTEYVFSSLFFGVVIDPITSEMMKNTEYVFSSPILRGSYRSDTLINSITTRVQVLF